MKEFIHNYIKKNRYLIYSLIFVFIVCCINISERFFYNYLALIWCILILFLIFSAYINIEIEYFYVTGFFVFICSLAFFIFGKQSIGIRFLYFSILIIVFGFLVKYFYKFYKLLEKSGISTLINLGFLILSVTIIFLSVLRFISYKNQRNLSEKFYKEAIHFYKDGEYENAIYLLNKSVNFNKRSYEAYNLLGRSYLKIEDYKESKKYLLRAIRLKSDYFDAIIALGTAYEKNNEFEKAISIYKKAKKMRPGDFGAYFGLGRTYYKINELEESLDKLLKAEKINPNNYELQYLLGSIYYQKNLLKEALSHFNLIKNKEVPKGFNFEDGKRVEDFIEEITIQLEI